MAGFRHFSIAVMQCVIAAKANTRRFVGNMLSAKTQAKLLTKVRELTPRSWGQSLRACLTN
jgi:hypothetical protein